jgi:diguanylate cyclase (GGDEF)-like protein
VNDTCGHLIGDQLLRQAGSKIAETLRKEDMVARIGGDEFMVLAYGLASSTQAGAIAERILKNFDNPITIDGQKFYQNLSIGIATSPKAGQDRQTLMQNVDQAMFQAKQAGKHRYKFYSWEVP